MGDEATAPGEEVGELSVGEMRAIEVLRQNSDTCVHEIGLLEVRKARMMSNIQDLEAKAQQVLQAAAKRLNITPGDPWYVTPDGKVHRGTGPVNG